MRKRNIVFLIIFFYIVAGYSTYAQTYYIVKDDQGVSFGSRVNGKFVKKSEEDLKNIQVRKRLKFDVSDIVPEFSVKIESVKSDGSLLDVTKNGNIIQVASNQYTVQSVKNLPDVLKITVSNGSKTMAFDKIGLNGKQIQTEETAAASSYTSWRDYLGKNDGRNLKIIKNKQRYFNTQNRAYLCLDPFGNIIGRKPVNIDQDDEIIILMVVPDNSDYDNYSINDNDAEYAPTDLSFRETDEIQSGQEEDVNYRIREFPKGPYTDSDVTFTVMKGSTVLNNITVHINKLIHVGMSVSYLSSNLASPDFQLMPLDSVNNTIVEANQGRRTFLTINAIWYWWPTIRYLAGSDLTRGRDVLKEPNLLTRINPTFGVSLKGNLENNFFVGGNFEFARGGSITAGWHYGKITRLLNRNFELGKEKFVGSQADIKTDSFWKGGFFVGVTLDNRIFNKLFSTSRATGD